MKSFIRQIKNKVIPPAVSWEKGFLDWNSAQSKATSYSEPEIFEKVLFATRMVKNGEAHHERDSVVFFSPEYNFALVSAIQKALQVTKNPLSVCDFGGALGSLYWQHRSLLTHLKLPIKKWLIVEQPRFVELGNAEFSDGVLSFATEPNLEQFDFLILSSVLQYLENPWEKLARLLEYHPRFVFFDRTGFTQDESEFVTLQKVRKPIYDASYPCWFLSRNKLIQKMSGFGYQLLFEFEALDKANISSAYRGTFWSLNSHD